MKVLSKFTLNIVSRAKRDNATDEYILLDWQVMPVVKVSGVLLGYSV